MTDVRPELIFVAGPQEGERAVLMRNVAIGGRSASADIQLTEQYVSRQQLQFELTHEGWIIENLTKNPIRINSRKYKSGKKILLDTGDVVGVGMETQILFVAPGDDPEDALSAYRQEFPVPAAGDAEPEAPEAPAKDAEAPPDGAESPPQPEDEPAADGGGEQEAESQEEQEERTEEDKQTALERKEKLKKYAIYGGVYVCLLAGGIFLLGRLKTNPPAVARATPPLRADEIAEILREKIEGKPRYIETADRHLARALVYHREIPMEPGNLYRTVKHFKLYLAFSGQASLPTAKLEQKYKDALAELIRQVCDQYRVAYQYEQNGNWKRALAAYMHLMKMVPAKEEPDPEPNNGVFNNVVKRITYVRGEIRLKEEEARARF